MSNLGVVEPLARRRVPASTSANLARSGVADVARDSRATKTGTGELGTAAVRAEAGPDFVVARHANRLEGRFDAAIGIKNALVGGVAFWAVALLLYSLL